MHSDVLIINYIVSKLVIVWITYNDMKWLTVMDYLFNVTLLTYNCIMVNSVIPEPIAS